MHTDERDLSERDLCERDLCGYEPDGSLLEPWVAAWSHPDPGGVTHWVATGGRSALVPAFLAPVTVAGAADRAGARAADRGARHGAARRAAPAARRRRRTAAR